MFERFSGSAREVMALADAEADRLHHDYVGPEHVLAGLAAQADGRAAAALRAAGLSVAVVRAGLDQLVADGQLPGRAQSEAELLRTIGVDIEQVRCAVEASFGADAVRTASRRTLRRSRPRRARTVCAGPLTGKAMLAKRAFAFAIEEAEASGQAEVGSEHLLLGILRDAQDRPAGVRAKRPRLRSPAFALPRGGPDPVTLIVARSGNSLYALRDKVSAALRAS